MRRKYHIFSAQCAENVIALQEKLMILLVEEDIARNHIEEGTISWNRKNALNFNLRLKKARVSLSVDSF